MRDRPNVVLIVADDMGYGDFGRYSEGRVHTPALDQLAADGLRLTQHYAGSPVCSPSRAALLTGRYPHRTGALTPQETLGYDRIALDEVTMADSLRASGYATGLVGKWHNGALDPAYHPNRRGFDEFVGFRGGWMDYYDWWLDRDGTIEDGDGRYLTDVLTDEAVSYIDRHRADSFFLTVAYNAPHSPLQAPSDIVERYQAAGHSAGIATTYAMIEVMDRGIASIRGALRSAGIEDDTLVMFTSDNGPAFVLRGDQVPAGMDPDTTRFNDGLNGAKGLVLEGGIRVPMILSWPGGLPSDLDIESLVHFTDWLPTLLSAGGASHVGDKTLDGIDVLPVLRGETRPRPATFWQWNDYGPVRETNAAMRDGDWKLVRPAISLAFASDADAALAADYVARDIRYKYERDSVTAIAEWPEPVRRMPLDIPAPSLFNLADDPGERVDLAATYPHRATAMRSRLDTWFDEVEAERSAIAPEHRTPRPVSARFAQDRPL
jgi:arylsulfatase A-like enzyme